MRLTGTCPIVFDCLGLRVQVASDSPRLARLVRTAWGEAAGSPRRPVRRYRASIEGTATPTLRGPRLSRRLDPREPVSHAYQIILRDLIGSVQAAFVLHGTSVARGGRAMLLCGPSTFGKTTLAVHLATRGFSLLGDDITLLRRHDGQVVPALRSLNLRPGTRSTLPHEAVSRARQAIRDAGSPIDDRADGEWAIDPARWPGLAPDPCPLAVVVVLQPSARPPGPAGDAYDIQVVAGQAPLLAELWRRRGVRDLRLDPGDATRAIVRVDSPDVLTGWLQEHADAVVCASMRAPSRPAFDRAPELRALGRAEAAMELCRQMLNRHEDSALGREFRGAEARLVSELAAVLAGARCWALVPGELHPTVGILAGCFSEACA